MAEKEKRRDPSILLDEKRSLNLLGGGCVRRQAGRQAGSHTYGGIGGGGGDKKRWALKANSAASQTTQREREMWGLIWGGGGSTSFPFSLYPPFFSLAFRPPQKTGRRKLPLPLFRSRKRETRRKRRKYRVFCTLSPFSFLLSPFPLPIFLLLHFGWLTPPEKAFPFFGPPSPPKSFPPSPRYGESLGGVPGHQRSHLWNKETFSPGSKKSRPTPDAPSFLPSHFYPGAGGEGARAKAKRGEEKEGEREED